MPHIHRAHAPNEQLYFMPMPAILRALYVLLAVAAYQSGDFLEEPISPCGACRQVILESEERFGSPIDILLYGKRNIYLFKGARALLPFCFVGETMGYTIQTEKNTAYGKNTV